jgi:DNA-binding NarL/FixJ family response regulator
VSLRCVVADDQALVRGGLRMILEAAGVEVVAEAPDGAAAVQAVREHLPDVVLMDVRMPHVDGIEATRSIVAAGSSTRVLVLTTFDLDELVYAAVRAGAAGFLLKDTPPAELVRAVTAVAAGDTLLAPALTRRLLERFAASPDPGSRSALLARLTERETDVLRLVARGLSNEEIAAELYLGVTTVKTHVARLLTKLGARDRVQAVVAAYEAGLVSAGS